MSAEAPSVFGSYVRDASSPRDWATSFLASSAIYVGLAIAIITLGSAAKKVVRQAAVEVKFVEKIVNEPPPAPPPPVAETKPQAPRSEEHTSELQSRLH